MTADREPQRIQRRRTKGWRMPEGAIYVGRPSRWGNPFTYRSVGLPAVRAATRVEATDMFRRATVLWIAQNEPWWPGYLAPLRGRDLACWCPLDQPCHADVLLELASRSLDFTVAIP